MNREYVNLYLNRDIFGFKQRGTGIFYRIELSLTEIKNYEKCFP
jgi:hypothetical protein